MMLRSLPALLALVLAAGCATPVTQLTPVPREAVEAEEAAQRELVLVELARAQGRLDRLAFPLLAAATPLCQGKTGPRMGVSFRHLREFAGPWSVAAASALQASDTLSVSHVTPDSPAERAGLRAGDRVLAVNQATIPADRGALDALRRAMATLPEEVPVTVAREGAVHQLTVVPETVCDLGARVTVEGDINAFADGRNIIFPWAMMRFANDDELRTVVAHEIAHNAMGHIEARQKNALLGGIFGAIADIALATQGVNTGGEHTAGFMRAAAAAFSQDFEREADYVGMYLMARAGVPLDAGPNLWRQFAQINPAAIGYASTHPTTAERFVRLRAAIEEIERKRGEGAELLPEMRVRR